MRAARAARYLAAAMGIVSFLTPSLARAEVGDKVPSVAAIVTVNVLDVVVATAIVCALRDRPVIQWLSLPMLVIPAAGLAYELQFSDIVTAVVNELGVGYIALVWLLVLTPILVGSVGYVRRTTGRRVLPSIDRGATCDVRALPSKPPPPRMAANTPSSTMPEGIPSSDSGSHAVKLRGKGIQCCQLETIRKAQP